MVGKDLVMATLFGSGGGSSGSGGGIPQEDIDAAFAALAEKGVTVPDGATSADLDELIASIETSGGSAAAACGSITPSETGSVQIEHGLGKTPDFFYVAAAAAKGDVTGDAIYTLAAARYTAENNTKGLLAITSNGSALRDRKYLTVNSTSFESTYVPVKADEISLTVGSGYYKMCGGVNYTWIMGCYE